MEAYVGEVRMFAGSYAPEGWALCDGSLLAISSYQVLYSLIGTTWGGDGTNTFGVPNLTGSVPVGQGHGTGLTARVLGQTGGVAAVALTVSQLPVHNHLVAVSSAAAASVPTPGPTALLASTAAPTPPTPTSPYPVNYLTVAKRPNPAKSHVLDDSAIQSAGASGAALHAHNNMMPGLAMTFIICTLGIYPQRPS